MKSNFKSVIIIFAVLTIFATDVSNAQFKNFITAKADKLMDGDSELRFISVNIPNLHYIEDYLPFTCTNPWRLPDEFEIRDALNAVNQIGGKVARIYVFSVHRQDDDTSIIRHVEAPGKFNEQAFVAFDKVLQVANELGIRLIVPFVDNWRWWGGIREYADFRGKSKSDFWTDAQIIDDFKKTIEFVINRKNTFTGISYKDDKAILAWETGNELQAPFSWTKEIAAYIKSLDKNHLVMEGTMATKLTDEALSDPNIDVLSTHHYRNPKSSMDAITENRQMAKGKKPYLVGEYGIVSTEDIRILTDTIINQGLSGGMIWSLRQRNREGGFYQHYEYNKVGAYRWPGFINGDIYSECLVLAIIREKAHQIDSTTVPRLPIPLAPKLLSIKNVGEISWQGSTGAEFYKVERRSAEDTTWGMIADNVDESRYQYRPLFDDETAVVGKTYFYRVKAKNEIGESEYSNIIGPVVVNDKEFFDEMENFNKVFQKDGSLQLLTHEDIRRAREDRSRLTGDNGSYIVYKVPATASAFRVDALIVHSNSKVQVSASTDMTTFTELKTQNISYGIKNNDYGFYVATAFAIDSLPAGTHFVKVSFSNNVQICRIEYHYK